MGFVDRLLTIVVTATLTSGAWIVWGSTFAERASENSQAIRSPPAIPAEFDPGEPLEIPVQGVTTKLLSDTFNQDRGEGTRAHQAIDILAPAGTAVLAAAGGVIEKLHLSEAGGLTIYVRSVDLRTMYYYAHLQDYAPGLAEGQRVLPRQMIGTVGISGNASPSGPHLHFAVFQTEPEAKWYDPATAINPYPLLKR